MDWLRKTGLALALQGLLAGFLLLWQILVPASSALPSRQALAADAGAKTLPIILVSAFTMDVAATVSGTTFPLGRVADLRNFVIRGDQPLPSVPLGATVSVAGTTATSTGTLVVSSYDPLVLTLSNFTVSLATGQTAVLPDISQTIPLPISGPYDFSVPTSVSGIGDITLSFSGNIAAVRFQ